MVMQRYRTAHGLVLDHLRRLREEKGLTQEALAAKSGMSRPTISHLEVGGIARLSTASRLAEALGIPAEALIGDRSVPSDDEEIGVLTDYFKAAMLCANYRTVGSPSRVYGTIPHLEGLWARGGTRQEAERALREALEWYVLTAVRVNRSLPEFNGASLEIIEEGKSGTQIAYPVAD